MKNGNSLSKIISYEFVSGTGGRIDNQRFSRLQVENTGIGRTCRAQIFRSTRDRFILKFNYLENKAAIKKKKNSFYNFSVLLSAESSILSVEIRIARFANTRRITRSFSLKHLIRVNVPILFLFQNRNVHVSIFFRLRNNLAESVQNPNRNIFLH